MPSSSGSRVAEAASAPRAQPFFRPRRIAHANLFVADLNTSMQFYSDVAGIEEVYRVPASGGGFVSNGNTHHDIGFLDIRGPLAFRAPHGAPGLYHLGFELESEVALLQSYNAATAAGLEMRPADHDIVHSVYITAPGGVLSELYADVIKDWRRQRAGIVTKPKPNWYPGMTPPVAEPCYHESPEIRRVEQAVFHPRCFDHAMLVCEDFEASFDHYTSVVGCRALVGGRDQRFAALCGSLGNANLFLFRSHPGRSPGCHHLGFVVEEERDLRESIERLGGRGLAPELILDHPGRLSVFVRDPDGMRLKFYCDRKPASTGTASVAEDLAIYLGLIG